MNTKIWAHRGASGYAPENTLESFELAIEQKADGIELDVQMTKDGELVVIHDETINRTGNGTGRVQDHTLKELKALNFNKTHPEYASAKIPTLREVYELVKPSGITVNVEMKTGVYFYPGICGKVLELAEEMGMKERIWYSSFNHSTLVTLKKLDPGVRTGILYADGWLNVPEYASRIQAEALHPAYYNLQYAGFLTEAKQRGLKLHVWTVNDSDMMEYLAKEGVDAIITNYPDRARRVLTELGV